VIALAGTVVAQVVPGMRGVLHRAALPLWQIGSLSDNALGSVAAIVRSRASFQREIETLKKDMRVLQLMTLELPLLAEENRRLQALWSRRSYDESVLGRVLARPSATPYDTFVLDVGSLSRVAKGDLVLVENVAIGTVSNVFLRTSIVQLFSAPGVQSNISIATSSIPVVARGIGGGNFIGEVPRGINVEKGDVVVLPDVSSRVFAVVAEVQADASDPFRTILFQLPINIAEIDWVEVVIEGARPFQIEEDAHEESS
jgi:cell shape-determining protein MreC